jgi:UDP-N-acetylglucosamine:LPS N-acetylglucosamine transferase
LVQEADLDGKKLANLVQQIIGNPERKEQMRQAARALDVPDAAARVCQAIEAAVQA